MSRSSFFSIVDELTDTSSDKNRECKGQGIANIAAGLLGGMAGCAMIGQSIINLKSGGRGRLSTFVAGTFLLILVVFLSDWVSKIPMAALVSVMIMVCIGTFSWTSLKNLQRYQLSTNIVMIATVVVVVFTHNHVSQAHFWDITSVATLDKVVIKFRRAGVEVEVVGLNAASSTLVDRFGVHDKPDSVGRVIPVH